MSNQVEEALRKAVEHAKRAGALMPPSEPLSEEQAAQQELEARRLGIGDKSNQSSPAAR